jgi:hypothetical protein
MSKLIIRAGFGPIENRQTKEAIVDNQISQKVLSIFFRCNPEDLEKVSADYHVPQEIIPKGEDKAPAVFYKVGVIPDLLSGLQKEIIKTGNLEGKEWLTSLDTTQDTFEFELPSGSRITFSRD